MRRDDADGTHSRGTILVVDDEPTILELYVDILRSMRYGVLAAEDGRRAIDLVAAHGSDIDLIILDWAMPNMHGRECLEAIQQIAPSLPVLIASGHCPDDPALLSVGSGASAILCKPFAPEVLLDAVSKVMAGEPVDDAFPSFVRR